MPGPGMWHAVRRGMMEDESITLGESWPYFLRCLPYVKPYLKQIMLGSVCILLHTGAGAVMPLITMFIIDRVIPLGSDGIGLLNLLILGWLALALAENLLSVLQRYLFSFANQSIFHDLRTQVFRHMQKLPLQYFQREQTGNLVSRVIYDVNAMGGVFGQTLTDLAVNILTIVVISILMFYLHPVLALIALLIGPFFAFSFMMFRNKMKNVQKRAQEKWAQMSGNLQERLSGITVTKAFVREDYEADRFAERSADVVDIQVTREVVSSLGGMITHVIGVLGPMVITWYGVLEIIHGNLTLGEYFALNAWALRLLGPFRSTIMLMFGIQFSLGAAERVFEILEIPPEEGDTAGSQDLPEPVKGHVVLDSVVFAYEGEANVLKGVNMEILPGQKVALVGLSGAGKSTIARLLLRFYRVQSGRILIDGYNIANVRLESLRGNIGLIEQDTFLFNASVKENILYGRPAATDGEVVRAAKAAHADSFINELPDGYDTLIGERGVRLSGGQKQRLAVARAFLKNPPILILDEATSSLDSESEQVIYSALQQLMKGRTTIIISHRLATLQEADKIYVLDNGEVVQEGTHLQLIEQEGLYGYLFQLQYLKTGREALAERTDEIPAVFRNSPDSREAPHGE